MKVFRCRPNGKEGFDVEVDGLTKMQVRLLDKSTPTRVLIGVKAPDVYNLRAVRHDERRESKVSLSSLAGVWIHQAVWDRNPNFFIVERRMLSTGLWAGARWHRLKQEWVPRFFTNNGEVMDETGQWATIHLAASRRIMQVDELPEEARVDVPKWLFKVKGAGDVGAQSDRDLLDNDGCGNTGTASPQADG